MIKFERYKFEEWTEEQLQKLPSTWINPQGHMRDCYVEIRALKYKLKQERKENKRLHYILGSNGIGT